MDIHDLFKELSSAPSSDRDLKELSSLQFALTLEAIWNMRNKVVHGGGQINLIAIIKSLEKKVIEFKEIVEPPEYLMQEKDQTL